MNLKSIIKGICFLVVCTAVVVFLYSRMHVDYQMSDTKQELNEENEVREVEEIIFPEHYKKKVDESLSFDVTVCVDEKVDTDNFYNATAKMKTLDKERIVPYFMGENAVLVQESEISMYCGDGYGQIYKDEEKELVITDNFFSYYKIPDSDCIFTTFYTDENTEEYNADLYSLDSDLDFMPREEAWSQVIDCMEVLGIDLTDVVQRATYSLDMETMEREEICIDVDGNIVESEMNQEWSKENEGYYYFIEQSNQGIPIYYINQFEGEYVDRVKLRIFQTKNGIVGINFDGWYDVELGEEKLRFLPFEEIMNVIEKKYSGTIMTNPLTVKKATLYTFPMQTSESTYVLVPVWACTIEEELADNQGGTYTQNIYMPINAITGEEMLKLEIR